MFELVKQKLKTKKVKQQNVLVCLRFVKVVKQYTKIQIKNKIFRKYLKLHISFKDKSFILLAQQLIDIYLRFFRFYKVKS